MPWARIDDGANSDAKLLALSDSAYRLWVAGLIFCQRNLTDGFIPTHAIETFGVRARNKAALVEELTRSVLGKRPLWQEVPGGWRFNDFFDWNESRDHVLKQRAKGKDRVDRFRSKLNGRNGSCNALQDALHTELPNELQTPNERSLFAASTSTSTEDQNQEQREDAPGSPRNRPIEMRTMAETRSHMLAACHRTIDANPGIGDGALAAELKDIAARDLKIADYDGRSITRIIDATRARREQLEVPA